MPENFDDSLPRPQREDLCGCRGDFRKKKNAEPTGLEFVCLKSQVTIFNRDVKNMKLLCPELDRLCPESFIINFRKNSSTRGSGHQEGIFVSGTQKKTNFW
jgi:hypothetical protein